LSLAITVGAGRARPQGRGVKLAPTVEAMAGALLELPRTEEAWWSTHVWKGDYRLEKSWVSSSGVAVDIDFKFKKKTRWTRDSPELVREPTKAEVEALAAFAASGAMPGNMWHPTPGGGRVVAVFDTQCVDSAAFRAAARGFGALLSEALAELPYYVDVPLLEDLARYFYGPNAFAKGVQRSAEVVTLRAEPFTAAELAAHAPPPEAPKPRPVVRSTRAASNYAEAVRRWNSDHPLDIERHSAPCPMCGDSASFGRLPDDDQRWYCFSTDHDRVGIQGAKGWHGDALDLDAFYRGLTAKQVLIDDGYLEQRSRAVAPPAPDAPPPEAYDDAPPMDDAPPGGDDAPPAPVARLDDRRRPLRNNSYATAVTIIRHDLRGVLGGRKIELNEMTGRPEFGRRPMTDEDASTIREQIELRHKGGVDKNNNETGLKIGQTDIDAAVRQVARENVYHPVRDYLTGLKWDGVERLDHVAADILNAEDSTINRVMVRKFFISAVARAMEPGCKVDTVLILIGGQGKKKSTFFDIIGVPWFVDSNVDIRNKDAYAVIRNAWIFEWGEFGKLMRVDIDTVKSFTASRKDTYRPSHGRYVVDVPRSGVFVATINGEEFLVDDENRRWWTLKVGARIEFAIARAQRDQLWAEALAAWRAWVDRGRCIEECPWWLTDEEATQLVTVQGAHVVSDAWEGILLSWASKPTRGPFTTSAALGEGIGKEPGQWTKSDEIRVARILKGAGFERKSEGPQRVKKWSKA
jgi:hypothetical protein